MPKRERGAVQKDRNGQPLFACFEVRYMGSHEPPTRTGWRLNRIDAHKDSDEIGNPLDQDVITIKGTRLHNLKNITFSIPKNKLVVFTGLSGSGKSTLAFDTLARNA